LIDEVRGFLLITHFSPRLPISEYDSEQACFYLLRKIEQTDVLKWMQVIRFVARTDFSNPSIG